MLDNHSIHVRIQFIGVITSLRWPPSQVKARQQSWMSPSISLCVPKD
jgi:hypothetical protein